jgi:hypothetical protein
LEEDLQHYFHEQKHLGDHPFMSDCIDDSHKKVVVIDSKAMHQLQRPIQPDEKAKS